jgi:hypothetical protein
VCPRGRRGGARAGAGGPPRAGGAARGKRRAAGGVGGVVARTGGRKMRLGGEKAPMAFYGPGCASEPCGAWVTLAEMQNVSVERCLISIWKAIYDLCG